MPVGPGKYDAQCMAVMLSTQADAVIVMVAGGNLGSGFSLCSTTPTIAVELPKILRDIADQIERDVRTALS